MEGKKNLKGVSLLLCAAFSFALSTVFLKTAIAHSGVTPAFASFARFGTGLVIFGLAFLVRGGSLRPNRPGLVALRALLNTFAVFLLYAGLRHTTVTKANLLNLTYPAFIFVIAPFINREKAKVSQFFFLVLALAGAALIAMPPAGLSLAAVNAGDLLAFASGVVAAFAISVLRETRRHDRADLIVFYVFLAGTVLSAGAMLPDFGVPAGRGLAFSLVAALLAVGGQFALTVGYRYINAVFGSIVLESGVLFSAALGVGVMGDPLTLPIAAGGCLIVAAIAGVSGILKLRPR